MQKDALTRAALLAIALAFQACSTAPAEPSSTAEQASTGAECAPRILATPPVPPPLRGFQLTASNVDEWLAWFGSSRQSQTDEAAHYIQAVANNDAVLGALRTRLFAFPVLDYARHLMILSALGQTKNPKVAPWLVDFIWTDAAMVPPAPPVVPGANESTLFFNPKGGLEAKAVECLAWILDCGILAQNCTTPLRHVVHDHPQREVRLAAIDAVMFNAHESEAGAAFLASCVLPDEAKLIGMARQTANMTDAQRATFDQKFLGYYRDHPEDRPELPQRVAGAGAPLPDPAPPSCSTVTTPTSALVPRSR